MAILSRVWRLGINIFRLYSSRALDPVGGLDNSVFFEIKSSNLPLTIVLGMMENRSI